MRHIRGDKAQKNGLDCLAIFTDHQINQSTKY